MSRRLIPRRWCHEMIPLQNQLERGVHELPFYTIDGAVILVAVNQHGYEVARVNVRYVSGYEEAADFLDAHLDACDPPRHLQLVAG